jgi:hypothetical protein
VELVLTQALLLDGVLASSSPRRCGAGWCTSPSASCVTPAG